MGLYIYQETGGTALVFLSEVSKPASSRIFNTVNGQTPYTTNFTLLEDFNSIIAAQHKGSKDYKMWRDALKTYITDLGGGDVEAGFNLLSTADKVTAAVNNIGTGAQILAAIPNFWDRYQNSQTYLTKMRGYNNTAVRLNRSIKAEAAFWAAAKHIETAPDITLPEAVLSDLEAAVKVNPNELTVSLLELYETKGLMGVMFSDGVTGVIDYFNETAGSRFAANGFKTRYPTAAIDFDGGTLDEFNTFIMSIFIDGNVDVIT
jgi:hypothetical protein